MGKRARNRLVAEARSRDQGQRIRALPMLISAVIASLITALCFAALVKPREVRHPLPPAAAPSPPSTLGFIDSLIVTPSVPADAEIALLNLACAPVAPSSPKSRTIRDHLKTLDEWASTVSDQTRKNYHRYLENPKEFSNETEWKLAMMCTILGKDFKVRYDPNLTSTEQQNASNRKFFANPESVFITGCLGESRIGTCASLPVLYVAIGKRIGYPMHLVAAKGHLFARWDDGKGIRVNLEAANAGGFTSHPDSHYRTWPHPVTPQEEKAGGYLQNLNPEQTLAIFLSTRAACLQAAGKTADAIAASAAAFRLAPNLGGIGQTLRLTVGGSPGPDLAELQYQQWVARQRSITDPMDPTPRLQVPGDQYSSQIPGIPQPGIPSRPVSPSRSTPNSHIPH